MKIFRTYSKSEQACVDAAVLCEMGLNAVVVEDRAYGGNILGATSASIRIELPEDQFIEAARLLKDLHSASPATEPQTSLPVVSEERSPDALHLLLKWILISDLVIDAIILGFSKHLIVVPPSEVVEFLRSLAFSDALWRLSFLSYWPLMFLSALANLLCLASLRIGRSLYTFTMVWALVGTLGPPPMIFGPTMEFIGGLQWSASCVAFALMYWSPLSRRFAR